MSPEHRRVVELLDKTLHEDWRRIFPGTDAAPGLLTYLMDPGDRGANIFVTSVDDNLLFVKYIRHASLFCMLEREYENVRFLQNTLTDGLQSSIPGVCELAGTDDARFLVFDHVRGERMSEILPPGGARRGNRAEAAIEKAVAWLVRFQQQTTSGWASVASFRDEFDTLADRYASVWPEPGPVQMLFNDVRDTIAGGADLKVRLGCCHGDFFPGNILIDGSNVMVVDWETMRKGALQTDDLFSLFLSYRVPDRRSRGTVDVLRSFRFVFMEDNWFSQMVLESIRNYCAESGLCGGHWLEALFVLYLLRQSLLEAEGILEERMMEREYWHSRLNYYATNRDRSILGTP
ncbi:MAG: phosphotransferase [Acidobacteria bacterium]|nr:phosphotransferase [Acidobacteriota bacterium]